MCVLKQSEKGMDFFMEQVDVKENNQSSIDLLQGCAERLIKFVEEYPELWYKRYSLFGSENDIRYVDDTNAALLHMYQQALNDDYRLRFELSKYAGDINSMPDEVSRIINRVREANVGRLFGLSKKNAADRQRLVIECGLSESILDFVFYSFGSYDQFKIQYLNYLLKYGFNAIKNEIVFPSRLITSMDITSGGKRKEPAEKYIDFLKEITGCNFLLYDGNGFAENINGFIDFQNGNEDICLSDEENFAVRAAFSLKKTGGPIISRSTRSTQGKAFFQGNSNKFGAYKSTEHLYERAINKLKKRLYMIADRIYVDNRDTIRKFIMDYFGSNDVFYNPNNSNAYRPDLLKNSDYSIIKGQLDNLEKFASYVQQSKLGLKEAYKSYADRFPTFNILELMGKENDTYTDESVNSDLVILYLYLKFLEYEIKLKFRKSHLGDEFANSFIMILQALDIRVAEKDIVYHVEKMINQFDLKISNFSTIRCMEIPEVILKNLEGYRILSIDAIRKMGPLYHESWERKFGFFFDMARCEMRRAGLSYADICHAQDQYKENITYVNTFNISYIQSVIETADISSESQKSLFAYLIKKLKCHREYESYEFVI